MSRFDYKTFNKRYEKFKKNNLPTPFLDRERKTVEYVFYDQDKLNVYKNLTDAFMSKISLFYPFNCAMFTKEGQKVIGHCHEHSFEDVVRDLYKYPVSFNITKKDEIYYTKRELSYLKILKNYLLLIGLNDIGDNVKVTRYRNKLEEKYQSAIITQLDNRQINNIIKGKCVFFAVKKTKTNKDIRKYNKGELQYLVIDNKYNFRLLIEYVEKRKQKYQEIKKQVKVTNTKDNDDVMVYYFKVLELFK